MSEWSQPGWDTNDYQRDFVWLGIDRSIYPRRSQMHGLGLRADHTTVRRRLTMAMTAVPLTVNKKLDVPEQYRPWYDQHNEGACVGFGFSWMMSILNRRKYDAMWLYHEAQLIDPWTDTPPGEGTSEVAGSDILINKGHKRVFRGHEIIGINDGIKSVEWADSKDPIPQLRQCIANGIPFGMAIPWFTNFDAPVWTKERGWVIGDSPTLGGIRGWHFICCYGARDKYDAFDLVNSWGYDFPLVKIPYKTVEYLGREHDAAFAVITDR